MKIKNSPAMSLFQADGDHTLYKTRILNLGAWDMSTSPGLDIAHGLTFSKIISAQCMIINDTSTRVTTLDGFEKDTSLHKGNLDIEVSNLRLRRIGGGYFSNINYDDSVMNRGFIVITYLP